MNHGKMLQRYANVISPYSPHFQQDARTPGRALLPPELSHMAASVFS